MTVQEQLQEMKEEIDLLRTLGTRSGFFKQYFKELGKKDKNGNPVHRTNVECFLYVNNQHYDKFGEEKYNSYDSFRRAYTYYLNSK